MGDDILGVLNALKINRAILVGHSIAGEELSSIGTRHPEKVSALIYLDAAYPYALYDPAHVGMITDVIVVRRELNQFGIIPIREARAMLSDLLDTRLPRLQTELQEFQQRLVKIPDTEGPQSAPPEQALISNAVLLGAHQYTKVANPALVLIALPHDSDRNNTSPSAKQALDQAHPRLPLWKLACRMQK